MEPRELDIAYEEPGLINEYERSGIKVHHIPYSSPGAAEKVYRVQQEAEVAHEKVTIHCTHGMGRSGRAAALWLVNRYGLSTIEAFEEVLETARLHGVERMGAPHLLEAWMTA